MATAEFTMIASDLLTIEPTVYQCWLAGLTGNYGCAYMIDADT
jgi:hypothetical protein